MVRRLFTNLRGALCVSLLTLNVILWFIPIFLISVAKLIVPAQAWRNLMSRGLMAAAENWISCNRAILGATQSIDWDLRGLEDLRRREWYLVISNHQSWVDILVLQLTLNRRVPFLKFFIKQVLIWVPFLGFAWWALDMPFMKRYSREFLEKHPEMRGRDLDATRKACEKFASTPTSVINFVEGTRVTSAKQAQQSSPYRHLLLPRAGGVAFVLAAMGGILHAMLDVTIVYPDGAPSFWDLCCGRLKRVIVQVNHRELADWLAQGDYQQDEAFRARFQGWVTDLWVEKDQQMAAIMEERS